MNLIDLTTEFAPAERASDSQIERDAQYFEQVYLVDTMLDAVPDIVLVLNKQRQIVFANEACLQQFGLTERRMALGKRPGELVGCAHSTELQAGCGTSEFCRTCGAVTAVMSSLRGVEAVQECRISLATGDALDLQVWAKPLVVNDEIFSVFSAKDISNEKRRQALERIFFHDVLNTAGAVSMCAEVLKVEPNDERLLNLLDSMAHRLVDEIKGQRTLLAAENGELEPNVEPIDVHPFLHEICQQYERQIGTAKQYIQLVDTTINTTMQTDPVLLGRVIGNMLKNAIEATPKEQPVTVSFTITPTTITFAVHNPTYMPRNIQLQIFNRSFSTKGAGRGLGTYSMKMLSERYLHGRIWFETTHDGGTTFYASYPLAWEA
ncbi:MAG: GHKL domain-containing protein [Anaerolineae bacterium]|nr:GHKL domain-containing protein [Anaerolineae bacterium]